jgi:anti-sigma factor RsiW
MTGHLSPERLVDYLAGLLDAPGDEELEAHLFSCRACALEAEKLFGLAAAVHRAVPPAISVGRFETLSREGRIAEVNTMTPGQVAEARFPPPGQLLVHRLGGSDLSRARRVDVGLLDLAGRQITHLDNVPFDAARGEVLLACQSHFADLFPADIVFRLEIVLDDRREEASRYTVLHRA